MYRDFDLKENIDQDILQIEPNQQLIVYYAVVTYKEACGKILFAGDFRTYEKPTDEEIASAIKKFNANYAEVHKRYEVLDCNFE